MFLRLSLLVQAAWGPKASRLLSPRRVACGRVMEAFDILNEGGFALAAGFPCPAPTQVCFMNLDERLDKGLVKATAPATH